jgi:hypothetical protein
MKSKMVTVAACVALLSFAASATGRGKNHRPGKLTGTWECLSHGMPQGDLPFTLSLEQNGTEVTGSVDSPMGGTEITRATFDKNKLEIQIDTPQGSYVLTARLKKGKLTGEWVHDPDKGTWEGSKQKPPATQ